MSSGMVRETLRKRQAEKELPRRVAKRAWVGIEGPVLAVLKSSITSISTLTVDLVDTSTWLAQTSLGADHQLSGEVVGKRPTISLLPFTTLAGFSINIPFLAVLLVLLSGGLGIRLDGSAVGGRTTRRFFTNGWISLVINNIKR